MDRDRSEKDAGAPAIPRVKLDLDMYNRMYGDEESTWRDLPMNLLPRTEEEERKLNAAVGGVFWVVSGYPSSVNQRDSLGLEVALPRSDVRKKGRT